MNRLAYPLQAQGSDRPDYLVSLPSGTVGIEITKAVPTSIAWVNARRNEEDHEKPIMSERFLPGEPLRSKDEINLIAQGGNAGSAWASDAAERQFAEVMIHFALQKKEKFGKKGYAICNKNWLVIYKHWSLPGLNEARGAVYLSRKLSELNEPLPFEKIFVECSKTFWEFSGSSATCLKINDLWNGS